MLLIFIINFINYNLKCTYHNAAHGNSQHDDREEQLHVCRPVLWSTAGEYSLIGTWLPYLYQSMKLSDFLISSYIRQPTVKVTLLKRPSNIWPSCSRYYNFEWAWHIVNLVITDTEMHCELAKMYINLVMFLLSTIYFQCLNHQTRH